MHLRDVLAASALLLAGCASMPLPSPAPLTIGAGHGSEHGNYPTFVTGETYRNTDGSLCPVFEWDRPLNETTAIRYRSTTCPLPGREGLFYSFNLDRRVMPLAESRIPAFLTEVAQQQAVLAPTEGRAPSPPAVSAAPLAPPKLR